jgi:hypothetical protein
MCYLLDRTHAMLKASKSLAISLPSIAQQHTTCRYTECRTTNRCITMEDSSLIPNLVHSSAPRNGELVAMPAAAM